MGTISGKNVLGRWAADLVNLFSPSQEAAQTPESGGVATVGSPESFTEQSCIELFDELKDAFSWQWDDRFEMVLAQIKIEEKDAILEMLEQSMGAAWDSTTIKKAPETVRNVVKPLGGIQSGQLLYTVGLPNECIVFCAWWPWNNGKTVSVRVGTSPECSSLLASLVPLDAR